MTQRIRITDFEVTDEGSRTRQTYSIDCRCWRTNDTDPWEVERVTMVCVEVGPDRDGGLSEPVAIDGEGWTVPLRQWLRECPALDEALQNACQKELEERMQPC